MHIHIKNDVSFILWLGGLCIDADDADTDDDDDDDDDDNYARWTNHDYIGSFGRIPNELKSGISQGSVLGLLLFVIFINDLPKQVNSEYYLFADDTKVFRKIKASDHHITLHKYNARLG